MGTPPTDFKDFDGNWTNPEVQRRHQSANSLPPHPGASQPPTGSSTHQPLSQEPTAPYSQASAYPVLPGHGAPSTPAASPALARGRRRPAFSLARRFFGVLCALLALATGLTGAAAYWSAHTITDTAGFTALTSGIASDPEFQQTLATAVTDDIMASPAISTYLGDGNSTTWYGGVQNWLYDQTKNFVDTATGATINSEAYPQLWNQVITDTHAYNFSGESRPAILDLSAIYDAAATSVATSTGVPIDTSGLPGRTLVLDTGQSIWPLNSLANTLIFISDLWPLLFVLSAAAALAGVLLWPGSRFGYLAVVFLIGAGLSWLASLLATGFSLTTGLDLPVGGAALTFLQKLSETIAGSFADFHTTVALSLLVAAALAALLAVLAAVLKISARLATARTR
ncbi:hypothetical protein [Rothia nasimurium]|uniref:hypothetical protein n=1 Tax=Rothia nasimurium TaxID=85336 RepID=UPI003BA0C093